MRRRDHDATAEGRPDDGARTPGRRGRRRLGTVALVALAFLAGSATSGAGAVWASHQFSDVPPSNQFHADIDWMVDNGITNGYADGTFKPTAPVSRQAAAAFLHRYNDAIQLASSGAINPGPGTGFQAVATCPVGTRAIGGNALTFDDEIVLQMASPTVGRDYVAVWRSRSGATVNPSSILASAICVPD